MDIPDEVMDDALRTARDLGRYPQWFLDLRAGQYSGPVPGQLTAAERTEIERVLLDRLEVAAINATWKAMNEEEAFGGRTSCGACGGSGCSNCCPDLAEESEES